MTDERNTLTPADEAHLKYLRDQVDHKERLRFMDGAPASAARDLFEARRELLRFVTHKRQQGFRI